MFRNMLEGQFLMALREPVMSDDLAGGGQLLKTCFAVLTNFVKAAGKYTKVKCWENVRILIKLQRNFRLHMLS